MSSLFANTHLGFSIALLLLLTACGGGGGGGGGDSNSSTQPTVDTDHDGLIEIASLKQLDWIRNDYKGTSLTDSKGKANSKGCPNSGCFGYELVADLDFDTNGDGVMDNRDTYYDYDKNGGSAGWRPIERFEGTLEGNGHHIRNLYINAPTGRPSAGLFDLIVVNAGSDVKIQNIIFDGFASSVTGRYRGGTLAANISNQGRLTISHITQVGKVTITPSTLDDGLVSSGWFAGGIIGELNIGAASTTVIDSNSATSVVESTNNLAGGLIGSVWGFNAESFTFTNNNSTTQVIGSFVGGLCARFYLTNTPTIFSNNSSAGSVLINGDRNIDSAGGLIGAATLSNGEFSGNHSSAAVQTPAGVAGGLIGNLEASKMIFRNSYASGSVTSSGLVGGLVGMFFCKDGVFIEESYASGNVIAQYSVIASGSSQSVSSSYAGGLVGFMYAPTSGTCGIKKSIASGSVSSGVASGGLVGQITSSDATGTVELSDNISMGAVTAYFYSGGLIGASYTHDGASILATRNLILGRIAIDPSATGAGVIGYGGALAGTVSAFAPTTATFSFNHWATNTTTTSYSIASPSVAVVQTGNTSTAHVLLACPISANDTFCAAGELYHDWDKTLNSQGQPVWDFGNIGQLPGLRIKEKTYRPVFDLTNYLLSIENP